MFRFFGAARMLTALLPLVLLGCGTPPYASSWDELRPGMTRSDVVDLIGEPSSRVRLEQPGGRVARERWQYGDDSTSVTSPTGLGLAAPEDVFVVTFGADGRVSSFRRPLVGRYAESPALGEPSGGPPG
jgi:hypothetical protein